MTGPRPGAAWAASAGELVDERTTSPGREEERERDLVKVYLQPGQLYASAQPSAVTTVLGSCVAICVWDPLTSVGGMNHYLLPFFAGQGHGSPRFGNVAMTQLLDRVQALGASRGRLQAKVFGGACVLEAFQAREGHLGEKNAGVAFKLLEELGIPVVSRDVGGRSGRKLIFHTDLGNAWVAKL
jgi:chemotaxis protein CheD